VSAASREAALAYVSELSLTPLEQYLEGLAAVPRTKPSEQKTDELPKGLENLSPEKLELPAQLLRKKEGLPERRLRKTCHMPCPHGTSSEKGKLR
jgi:hypothetical protein